MSRFLIDSHVLLWWADKPEVLSTDARLALADGRNTVFVSVASIWELGIKQAAGKIRLPEDIRTLINVNRFDVLPIAAEHAITASALPPHHRDPVDRMLIAQANSEGLTLVTGDEMIRQYDVKLLAA